MPSPPDATRPGDGCFVHEMPEVRVVFGAGTLDRVAGEAVLLGSSVLLIAGRRQDPSADRVAAALAERCAGRIDGVAEHVPARIADGAVGRVRQTGADAVVSLGGGSAVGRAKAIARETGIPILAVPTTCAGSEMTPIWGRPEAGRKATGRDRRVLPRTVVYDPELTLGLAPGLAAASGMNALAHAIEAAYPPDASPVTRLLSAESVAALTTALPRIVRDPDDLGVRLAVTNLRGADGRCTTALTRIVRDPDDPGVRRRAPCGAWPAGSVLGATTMELHHKLAHILWGTYSLPHAGTHNALLPQTAAFNAPAASGALASVARAVGGPDVGGIGPALFDLARATGAPTSLSQLGLSAAVMVDVVRQVLDAGIIDPRPLEPDAVAESLRDAVDGHRPGDFAGAEPGQW